MKRIKITKEHIGLTIILILSAVLNCSNLSVEGYGNEYYAAAVKSMTKSLKNFFFVSFDPTGFVTIDKPPVGFWRQAVAAKIFGYHGWSIMLPQAIAGILSVAIVYLLVKRYFGINPALISALCLAVTPVFVADSRNNTIDNQLVLALLVSTNFLFKSIDSGKIKYLVLSFIFVGIGFNIKMLQAYLIIPAVYLTYLMASKVKLKNKIINLAICTVILIAVSLSWAFIVDLVPASRRPYVGSSTNNSELELIVGHNGVERLSSSSGGGNGQSTKGYGNGKIPPGGSEGGQMPEGGELGYTPQGATNGKSGTTGNQGNGMSSSFGASNPSGITRLFTSSGLSDQISWLIPLALFGFMAAAIKEKLFKHFDNGRKLSLVFWITYFLPQFIYFSFTSGLFHPYYLTMLSAPIAALVGIGMKYMWKFYNGNSWKSFILPVALLVDGAIEILILSDFYKYSSIIKLLILGIAILCLLGSIVLTVNKLINISKKDSNSNAKLTISFVAIALVGLLISPIFWSATTLFYKMSGTFPSAGISLATEQETDGNNKMEDNQDDSSRKLISYLESNKTNEKYLLVTLSASGEASKIIINTNNSVMALGGFLSTDKIIKLNRFKQLVKKGEVRYVMVEGNSSDSGIQQATNTDNVGTSTPKTNSSATNNNETSNSNQEILNWAKEHGKLVDSSLWSGYTNNNENSKGRQGGEAGSSGEIYDLKGCKID